MEKKTKAWLVGSSEAVSPIEKLLTFNILNKEMIRKKGSTLLCNFSLDWCVTFGLDQPQLACKPGALEVMCTCGDHQTHHVQEYHFQRLNCHLYTTLHHHLCQLVCQFGT